MVDAGPEDGAPEAGAGGEPTRAAEPTAPQDRAAVGTTVSWPSPVTTTTDRPTLHVRLFGSRMFFRLWLAQVVSSLGDWLGFLAIAILAARVGGRSGSYAVGVVMAARIARHLEREVRERGVGHLLQRRELPRRTLGPLARVALECGS